MYVHLEQNDIMMIKKKRKKEKSNHNISYVEKLE